MAIKTKLQLIEDVVNQIVTNSTGLVTSAKVRSVLIDMIDSLSFIANSTGFQVVNRAALGVDSTQLNTIQYNNAGSIFYVDQAGTVYSHTAPSLQQITDAGHITTTPIGARDIYVYNSNGQYSVIKSLAVSSNYTANLPAKNGTVAFLDDLNAYSTAQSVALITSGSLQDVTPLTFAKTGGEYIAVLPGETVQVQGMMVITRSREDHDFFTSPIVSLSVSRSHDGATLTLQSVQMLLKNELGSFLPTGTVDIIAYKPDETQFSFRLTSTSATAMDVEGRFDGFINRQKSTPPTWVSLALTTAPSFEGSGGSSTDFVFTVTRSGNLTTAFNIDWATSGVGGGGSVDPTDFVGGVPPSGTLSFAAGEVSKEVSVSMVADNDYEPNESFAFAVSNSTVPVVMLTPSSLNATVNNDDVDAEVNISVADNAIDEGNAGTTDFTFTVTRSLNTNVYSSVDWLVTGVVGAGGSAAQAADFVGGAYPGGTVAFSPGEVTKNIVVSVIGDAVVEPSEDFRVTISDPVNCSLGATYFVEATITNDDV